MEGPLLHTSVSTRKMNIHDCPKINPHQKITFDYAVFAATNSYVKRYLPKWENKTLFNITFLISGKWLALILFSNDLNCDAKDHK